MIDAAPGRYRIPANDFARPRSSTGQSSRLLSGRFQVRILAGALAAGWLAEALEKAWVAGVVCVA